MFARYLKSQLMVLLFGGIVGPIFLVTFFLVRNSFGVPMWWMFYTGLFITALDVLIALWLTSFSAKSAADKNEKQIFHKKAKILYRKIRTPALNQGLRPDLHRSSHHFFLARRPR